MLCAKSLQLCLTLCDPMDCSCQAPVSIEFPRQEYWSGLPFPPPGDLPDPGIKSVSFISLTLEGGFFTPNISWETLKVYISHANMDCRDSFQCLCPKQLHNSFSAAGFTQHLPHMRYHVGQ